MTDQEKDTKSTAADENAGEARASGFAFKKRKKDKKKKTVGQEILSWVGTLLLAVVIAMTIRIFLAEPIRVDGRSMEQTLHDGEIVLVTKPAVLLGKLNRGDVVIVRYPGRNEVTSLRIWGPLDINFVKHQMFVKRLVALPGDSVAILNGTLYVNDKAVEEPYIVYQARADYKRTVLGENQYMVIGDNRANSHDSRSNDVGPISKDMIVGKASLVLLPLNHIRTVH
ncbi:MAG TPA: signal peptidase I [Clostridia bacterium]|jgi:signal peptidase I|nr:signal peptidase I [Clostridia bacterium]HPY43920.1 signal peptidase I [Clostridia bacterium]HQA98463.1 signal peptidase I [Clostridia bacterium]HQO56770.1 signal peptidase I [Clostridia bacterium]HUM60605.1 signal peptidase I [Clostridia bacterium]